MGTTFDNTGAAQSQDNFTKSIYGTPLPGGGEDDPGQQYLIGPGNGNAAFRTGASMSGSGSGFAWDDGEEETGQPAKDSQPAGAGASADANAAAAAGVGGVAGLVDWTKPYPGARGDAGRGVTASIDGDPQGKAGANLWYQHLTGGQRDDLPRVQFPKSQLPGMREGISTRGVSGSIIGNVPPDGGTDLYSRYLAGRQGGDSPILTPSQQGADGAAPPRPGAEPFVQFPKGGNKNLSIDHKMDMLPVPQFPGVQGTGNTADAQEWMGPQVASPDAVDAAISIAQQKAAQAAATKGPQSYTVGPGGLRFSETSPYKGIRQAAEDNLISEEAAGQIAGERMRREQAAWRIGPDGKFHPEAKLYFVNADPYDPKKAIYTEVTSANTGKIKNATVFVNGMANDLNSAAELGLNHTGKKAFYMIYNPSQGFSDFLEAVPERLGLPLTVDNTTRRILARSFDLPTSSIYAHSQGTLITNNALEDITRAGINTRGMKLYYDGSAANHSKTGEIANAAGATIERFEGNPYDFVHNVIGLNTRNPYRITGSTLLGFPAMFSDVRNASPHGLQGGGAGWDWAKEVPMLEEKSDILKK